MGNPMEALAKVRAAGRAVARSIASIPDRIRGAARAFFRIFAPLEDRQVIWGGRLLFLAAFALFVACLAFLSFPAFAGSIACAVWGYLFTREDVHRHPVELGLADVRADGDRLMEEFEDREDEAIYPLQAAGIPISLEKRSRWARRRG